MSTQLENDFHLTFSSLFLFFNVSTKKTKISNNCQKMLKEDVKVYFSFLSCSIFFFSSMLKANVIMKILTLRSLWHKDFPSNLKNKENLSWKRVKYVFASNWVQYVSARLQKRGGFGWLNIWSDVRFAPNSVDTHVDFLVTVCLLGNVYPTLVYISSPDTPPGLDGEKS